MTEKELSGNALKVIAMTIDHLAWVGIETTDMSIANVAARSGFSRVTTFNHDFKAHYNLTPSEYRRL